MKIPPNGEEQSLFSIEKPTAKLFISIGKKDIDRRLERTPGLFVNWAGLLITMATFHPKRRMNSTLPRGLMKSSKQVRAKTAEYLMAANKIHALHGDQ